MLELGEDGGRKFRDGVPFSIGLRAANPSVENSSQEANGGQCGGEPHELASELGQLTLGCRSGGVE
eukprot:3931829-Rhodomonas_salina.1